MARHTLARYVLAADGVGCALAAVTVSKSERIAGAIDPSLKSRVAVSVALGATSALLTAGAVGDRVTNRDLELAAAVNLGWVVTCLVGLRGRPSRTGTALIAATAILDAGAAVAQWGLRGDHLACVLAVDASETVFAVWDRRRR